VVWLRNSSVVARILTRATIKIRATTVAVLQDWSVNSLETSWEDKTSRMDSNKVAALVAAVITALWVVSEAFWADSSRMATPAEAATTAVVWAAWVVC